MFTPEVGEQIRLFGKDYLFQMRSGAGNATLCIVQGRKASVHQIRDAQGGLWALKVFAAKYRNPGLPASVERCRELRTLRGFDAANRRIIEPPDPLVSQYPDLEYAILMPWQEGATWADLLAAASSQNLAWPLDHAGRVCMRFLNSLRALESRGCAHTGIAAGHVILTYDSDPDVQLVSLEDMYRPDAPIPSDPKTGAAGYAHPALAATFCPEGDRFAAAVLAAEILLMSNPEMARRAGADGLFQGEARQDCLQEAYAWLRAVTPRFAGQFARAWTADALRDCPTISMLSESLQRDGIAEGEDTNRLPAVSDSRRPVPAVDPAIHAFAKSGRLARFAHIEESNVKGDPAAAALSPTTLSENPWTDPPKAGSGDKPGLPPQAPPKMPHSPANAVVRRRKPLKRAYAAMAICAVILMLAGTFIWFKMTGKKNRPLTLAAVRNTPASDPFRTGTGPDAVTLRHYGIAILAETEPIELHSGQAESKTVWPPEERARRLALRLNDNLGDVSGLIASGVSVSDAVKNVLVGRLNGAYIIYFKYGKAEGDKMGDVIFTVDSATARDCHTDAETLAYWWRDLLRNHLLITLGQPPVYPVDSTGQDHPPAPLVDLHRRLKAVDGDRVPDAAAFHQVEDDLLNHNLNDAVENLYRNVPADFHPLHDPDTRLNLREEDAVESN